MSVKRLFITLFSYIFIFSKCLLGGNENAVESPDNLDRIEGVYIHLVDDLEGDVMSHVIMIYPSYRFDEKGNVSIHYRVLNIIRPSRAADPKIEVLPTLYLKKHKLVDGLDLVHVRFMKGDESKIEVGGKVYQKQLMKPISDDLKEEKQSKKEN